MFAWSDPATLGEFLGLVTAGIVGQMRRAINYEVWTRLLFGALRWVADDGPDLESAAYLLGQVYRHLVRVARRDEVLQERGGEVFGEDPPVAEAPEVEFQGFGFDQGPFRAVVELHLVEVRLACNRAERRQLVRRELDHRVGI